MKMSIPDVSDISANAERNRDTRLQRRDAFITRKLEKLLGKI